jgi:hypothetical protein
MELEKKENKRNVQNLKRFDNADQLLLASLQNSNVVKKSQMNDIQLSSCDPRLREKTQKMNQVEFQNWLARGWRKNVNRRERRRREQITKEKVVDPPLTSLPIESFDFPSILPEPPFTQRVEEPFRLSTFLKFQAISLRRASLPLNRPILRNVSTQTSIDQTRTTISRLEEMKERPSIVPETQQNIELKQRITRYLESGEGAKIERIRVRSHFVVSLFRFNVPHELCELFEKRTQLDSIVFPNEGILKIRVKVCEIELQELEIDVMEMTNQKTEMQSKNVNPEYLKKLRSSLHEVKLKRVSGLMCLIENISISISNISEELEVLEEKHSEMIKIHQITSASAFCESTRDCLYFPEISSFDEFVSRMLRVLKTQEEIEKQYSDMIDNELKEEMLLMERSELRDELSRLKILSDDSQKEDFIRREIETLEEIQIEISEKQILIEHKRNEIVSLVEDHLKCCDFYQEQIQNINIVETQIEHKLKEYDHDRLEHFPGRAPRLNLHQ